MGKFMAGDRVRCLRADRHLSLSGDVLDACPGDLLLVTDGCGHGVFAATLDGEDGLFWDHKFELATDRGERRGSLQLSHPHACS